MQKLRYIPSVMALAAAVALTPLLSMSPAFAEPGSQKQAKPLSQVLEPKEPPTPLELLEEASGPLKEPASALLHSIEKRASHEMIQQNARALINAGGLDLVLGLLNNRFEPSELDVAQVLSELKSRKVARALLARYKNSDDTPNWRGEDELYFRSQARTVLEEALSRVTGVEPGEEWTFDQKITAYSAAIKRMKVLASR